MGKLGAFLTIPRVGPEKEPVASRVTHYHELERRLPVITAEEQGARCMSCGVPFCHTGCPLGNAIPDWNDHVANGRWALALESLEATNNFPEVTGRVCPAPCEEACVLRIAEAPVTIRALERAIADHAAEAGELQPRRALAMTGKRVVVVGSGPAGMACAQELARAGHAVTLIERDDRPGGLLRYGIPDFKLEKSVVERRVRQMQAEGVAFRLGVEVGRDVTLASLCAEHDAVVVATGAAVARELPIPGRELLGVHRAMDYLVQQNRVVAGDVIEPSARLDARGRDVVVLGGGDTGSDCVGTAHRQGARSVTQIELLPRPPDVRAEETPWPRWPLVMRTSSSQEEGGSREFAFLTKRFVVGDGGRVRALLGVEVEWDASRRRFDEKPGTEREIPCDLVLLALGFTGPEAGTWTGSDLATDARGNVLASTERFVTNDPKLYACGDVRRGQSLVVWAIWEGRECARAVDRALLGEVRMPRVPLRWALP